MTHKCFSDNEIKKKLENNLSDLELDSEKLVCCVLWKFDFVFINIKVGILIFLSEASKCLK